MRIAYASAVAICLISVPVSPVRSDDEGVKRTADKLPLATSASLRHLLSERIEIPDEFRAGPVPLKFVLTHLVDRAALLKEPLPITFDRSAYKDLDADPCHTSDASIEFPNHIRSMTFRQALELSVSQIPCDSKYLIRDGLIVIVPGAAAKIDRLLNRTTTVEFRNKPLIAAFEELSDRIGVSIAVDPRCDDMNKKTVTLQTEQGMTARGVLESIADMNELKIVVTPHRVTVLPHAVYLKRLADQVQEAKLRREIGNDPAILEGPRLEPVPNPAR